MNVSKSIFMILSISVLILSCNFSPSEDGSLDESEFMKDGAAIKRDMKYFSARKSGKWKDKAGDHMPQYNVTKDKKFIYIDVTVSLTETRASSHYVECIVLTDHNNKEMQKKTFMKGERNFSAKFKLPKDYKSYVYVISKCSLHDMWRVKIFPSSR